ncbi:MAG: YkvA family protein [Candidatus Binatia bacterium]
MAFVIEKWKERAKELKAESYALYFALKDPRVPWYAKLVAGCVVAYALSPIDLIPDFIPVIGYLDDLILVPIGIALTVKMIPAEVWVECREKARKRIAQSKLIRWLGAAFIVAIWILLCGFILIKLSRLFSK